MAPRPRAVLGGSAIAVGALGILVAPGAAAASDLSSPSCKESLQIVVQLTLGPIQASPTSAGDTSSRPCDSPTATSSASPSPARSAPTATATAGRSSRVSSSSAGSSGTRSPRPETASRSGQDRAASPTARPAQVDPPAGTGDASTAGTSPSRARAASAVPSSAAGPTGGGAVVPVATARTAHPSSTAAAPSAGAEGTGGGPFTPTLTHIGLGAGAISVALAGVLAGGRRRFHRGEHRA